MILTKFLLQGCWGGEQTKSTSLNLSDPLLLAETYEWKWKIDLLVVWKLKKILLLPIIVKTQNEKKIIKVRFSPFKVPEFVDEFRRETFYSIH